MKSSNIKLEIDFIKHHKTMLITENNLNLSIAWRYALLEYLTNNKSMLFLGNIQYYFGKFAFIDRAELYANNNG